MVRQRIPRNWLRTLVIVLGAAAVAIAVLLIVRGPGGGTGPKRLAVGDCFDVPAAADRIGDVPRRACSGPHDGEVFNIFDSSTAGGSTVYPTDAEWEGLVYPVCDPVFETYTGSPVAERVDIEYRYLVPTADRWAAGDRRVTCFITSPDGSPLTQSFRATP